MKVLRGTREASPLRMRLAVKHPAVPRKVFPWVATGLVLTVLALCARGVQAETITVSGSTGPLTINTSVFTSPITWFGMSIAQGDSLGFSFTINAGIPDSSPADTTWGNYLDAVTQATFWVGNQNTTLSSGASMGTNLVEVHNIPGVTSYFLVYVGNNNQTLQVDVSTQGHSVFLSDQLSPLGGVGVSNTAFDDFQTSRGLLCVPGAFSGTAAYAVPISELVFTPEPATLSLLVLGGLAVLRRKAKHRRTGHPTGYRDTI